MRLLVCRYAGQNDDIGDPLGADENRRSEGKDSERDGDDSRFILQEEERVPDWKWSARAGITTLDAMPFLSRGKNGDLTLSG